jgi:DNA (cytosine-5)-methyltransferase 1
MPPLQPERVERYLVVHGQILLNQIKAYPSAAVQKAPFVGALRDKMEARKHSKLFYSKRGFSKAVKVVNRNPMKVRTQLAVINRLLQFVGRL